MGRSSSPAELIRKIEDTTGMAGKNNKRAIKNAAVTFKQVGLRMLAEEVGSDLQLSHWRYRNGQYIPLKLNIGFELEGERDVKAIIRPRPWPRWARVSGPWYMLEFGAQPHRIVPKPSRVKRQTRGKGANTKRVGGSRRLVYPPALRLGNGQMRYGVNHPGTRPTRLWSRIGREAKRPAWERYRLQMARETVKRFQ